MKRAFNTFWTIVVATAVLLCCLWMLIQTPGVQTFVAKKVTKSLEDRFNGRIEFSKIHIKPFSTIVLKDVAIIDGEPPLSPSGSSLDTIARARSITASFSPKGLFKGEGLHLGKVTVSDAAFTVVIEGKGVNNLKRFINAAPKDSTRKKEAGNVFDARKVSVDNFTFNLVRLNGRKPAPAHGMDWEDLSVTVHSLSARDLGFSGGYMTGTVDDLSATEKSGYHINSLSGRTKVGHGVAMIEDIRMKDPWSDIDIQEYSMRFDDIRSFSHYIDEVRMTGHVRKSVLDFRSLSYFAPALEKMDIRIDLAKADVDGTVRDLGIGSFDFREEGSGVSGSVDGRITGLPDVKETVLDFQAHRLDFTSEGLGRFISGFAPGVKASLGRFAPGEQATFTGRVNGRLDDLRVTGGVKTGSMGSLETDLKLGNLISKGTAKVFKGTIDTDRLDIGKIAGIRKIGEVTLRGGIEASLDGGSTSVRLDSLFVDKFKALDYEYSNILATGIYTDKAFDGRLVCNDPNLNLLFQGIFTLSDVTSNGLYKFYANIGYADLEALGLDKRGVSKVSARINANYMAVSSGDIIGDLDILDLNLENFQGAHDIGDIRITSHSNNNLHRINIGSSFADGSYVGSKPLTGIVKDLRELTVLRELPVMCKDTTRTWAGDTYDVRLDVHDARDFLSFVMPGLYIADGTKARVTVSGSGDVKATVKSSRIAQKRNYLRDVDLAFDNKDGSLNAVVTGSELVISGLSLKNDNITLYAAGNHIGIGCSYDNQSELTDKGEIYLSGELEHSPEGELLIHGKALPSNIWVNDDDWTISPTTIEIAGKDIKLDNLTVACDGQSVRFDGGYSSTAEDTLTVDFNRFNMALANRFAGEAFGIRGLATGAAKVTSPWKGNAGLLIDLACDSVQVAGNDVGKLYLGSSLDEAGVLHLDARNDLDGKQTLRLGGDYFTKRREADITAELDGFDAGYLAPVLASVFSEADGSMSGKIRISGKTDALSIRGEDTRFDDVLLRVAFTNVQYRAKGPFSISDNGLVFENIALTDRYDGTGTLSGGILFNRLKDFRMDTRIRMNRMEAVDLGADSGQAFYGNLFASGDISITGPFNAIQLDINARTDKNGTIHIPVNNASKEGSSNLLTFKEPYREVYVDPYDVMMNRLVTESRKENDLSVRIRVNANQGTEAFVEIDRSAGNVLNGRGQGNLDIAVRPARDLFTINGDYSLESGNFHFNAMDIASRDFALSRGSSIRFNGDVMESDLDINGVYTAKASIAPLIADTSAVSTRRTVNCGIGISGKLREPKLSFDIDVPDLDPTTKSKVESALTTEDKVQRQFIYLLISGGFMPDEQSGVVNNTGNLYTNLAEMMAGQLNSILQKLDIPLDFGLNYQSGQSGNSIFDVAVSTQLFNNRVIVNGNVGNREYGNSANGDVVGDLDIEIKLDKPGQVRLNLFSHSADDYTNYLDNTQRNGVGITYQREFNTFTELVKSIFTSRKKRERERSAAPQQREVNGFTLTPSQTP